MDLSRIADLNITFEHRHDDGTVGRFEPESEAIDPSELDPERQWASGSGTIYKCTTCDEEIIVGYEEPDTLRP